MRNNSRAKLILPLLTALVIVGVSAFPGAQAQANNPGQSDPVGPPASYIILRDDNLALSYVRGANNVFDTYEADLNNPATVFDKPLTSNNVPAAGTGSTVSVAGRILSQDKDQLVIVGRSGSTPNAIKVRFALGGDYALSNLHDRLADAPDQISVAAGDLDKIPDANGANHDELVLVYAGNNGVVNVAVLNYTDPQASASRPKYVTQAVAPFKVNLNPTAPDPINGGVHQGFKVSEVLAVAVGDFDGDGQNEIALAALDPLIGNQVNLAMFRYVHPTLSATPTLKLIATKSFSNIGGGGNVLLLPTISLAAGDFDGTATRAELVLAVRQYGWDQNEWDIGAYRLEAITFDDNLTPTLKTEFAAVGDNNVGEEVAIDVGIHPDQITATRILCLSGLINYTPTNGFNLYRRGIVVLWNRTEEDDLSQAFGDLNADIYKVDKDLEISQDGHADGFEDPGVDASFAATLGGFGVDGNINNPVWSLAVATVRTRGGGLPNEETVSVFQNINGHFIEAPIAVHSFDSQCPISVCDGTTQNALRPAIQAYDYQGGTVLLGAPIKITVPEVISTDFVLQDPPKDAYWDETKQQHVVISRFDKINVSMTNKDGVTYTGKSTDTSASSVGGSDSATASASIKTNVLGIFKLNLSSEVTAKATYNFSQNEASYNSNYPSRVLTETENTVGDDFVSGRMQQLTIWRYRVLGETGQDSAGKTLNLYYDVVFPEPSTDFKASGLDLPWYHPIHEPGNILSYPAPAKDTFSPADMGTYEIPCSGANCNPNGTKTMTGPMIPPEELFLSQTSGSLGFNYMNTSGSGNTIGYQHKLGTSQDVKVSYSAEVSFLGGEGGGSVAFNTNSENSFGNTTTSDSTSTSETGITINRAAIGSTNAYAIYPTLYTTLDGTIKVAFAADPLASAAGKSFWAGLYGVLPDPALNLPLRFVLSDGKWIVNELSDRKQMRGFFVLNKDPDPVTGQYDILGPAPIAGDKVRLSAQVYNYSTAQPFKDCSVQFYAIKYDSNTNMEQGQRQLIGETMISLPPRGTAPAQVIWDTAKFGPASGSGSQDYRIYVDLNYKSKIDEKYPPENPAKTYAPMLPAGLDPGQNDEGFGLATVMASSPPSTLVPSSTTSSSNQGSRLVTFSSTPLALAMGARLTCLPVTLR